MPVFLLIDALECGKQIRDILFFDSDAGVADRVNDIHHAVLCLAGLNGELDKALVCILDCVIQHVDENLLDPHFVADQLCGDIRRDMHLKIELFLSGTHPQHSDDL